MGVGGESSERTNATAADPEALAAGSSLTKTVMPKHCPSEILDYIVDFLHDNPDALKRCCLVSKSWIPRCRKHLFAVVEFDTPSHLETWRKTFTDPSNSPARYTRALSIRCLRAITEADAAKGGWIQTFSRVAHFTAHSALTPHSQFLCFIYCLPLLEDITLSGSYDEDYGLVTISSSPPPLTGTLRLNLPFGISRMVRRLLDIPYVLRFRGLGLLSYGAGDLISAGKMVEACSDTLEYLDVEHRDRGATFSVHLVD